VDNKMCLVKKIEKRAKTYCAIQFIVVPHLITFAIYIF